MAHLALSLLGPFQATLADQPVTGFESDKVRALLSFLAVEAKRPHRRDSLAALRTNKLMSHARATQNLGYQPRPFRRSMEDALHFYSGQNQYTRKNAGG